MYLHIYLFAILSLVSFHKLNIQQLSQCIVQKLFTKRYIICSQEDIWESYMHIF